MKKYYCLLLKYSEVVRLLFDTNVDVEEAGIPNTFGTRSKVYMTATIKAGNTVEIVGRSNISKFVLK